MTASAPGPTPRQLFWRLSRRIYGYARRHTGLLLGMILIMALLAAVDRGRVMLIQPLAQQIDAQGAPIACDRCAHKNPAREEHRFCAACGDPLDTERAAAATASVRWNEFYRFAWLGVAASLLIFPLKYGRVYLSNLVTNRVLHDIRNELNTHLLTLPLRYFHDRRAGDIISRVSNDTVLLQSSVSFLLEDIVIQPFYMLAATGIVLHANWKLGIAAILFFPIYSIPIVRIGRAMRRTRKKSLERLGELTESMTQMYGGIRVVKAFHREKEEQQEFERRNNEFFRKIMSTVRKKALADSLVEVFISLGLVALIALAGLAFFGEKMTQWSMIQFVLGLAMVNTPVKELTKGYNRLQESLAASQRIFEILDAEPEPPDPPDAVDLPEIRSGVEYRGITFSYNSEPVLRDVRLRASPGEVIALVGRSGAGKSTLVDLLCRYYDPQQGEIAIDGVDLRRIRRSSLRSNLAVVAQDTYLFNTTIGENIRYGRPDATKEQVEAAAKAAMIHDFILTLEQGYETVIGERGAKLSGGQRQRISIARAVLKDPAILVLDEATSALDSESEKQVQEALHNLLRSTAHRRITFVIAHRLSTVREADRIVVLDEGRIVEEGRHEDLITKGGLYAQLHRMQFDSA